MNRAAKLDGKRRSTAGFALTVLQRRLASSRKAICRSLERRAELLERRKQEVSANGAVAEAGTIRAMSHVVEFDDEELLADELEEMVEELVDAATAARTVQELDAELAELRELIDVAARVRASEIGRKRSRVCTILDDHDRVHHG